MKMNISIRLWAFAALGWAMLCPAAMLAQTSDENTNTASSGNRHDQVVRFGKDVELPAGDTAGEVVVIGGGATIHGTVDREVVVIGGDVRIDGSVGSDVVAIMGNAVVGPKARISGQLVTVGGTNNIAEGGKVSGEIVEVGAGLVPSRFLQLRWLRDWISQCVLELRPLAPGVGWVWCIAGFFFFIYLLIALLFRHPVQCCTAQMSARPATTLAAGILTKLALPILCILLVVTVIGTVVLPFLVVGLFLTTLVGKVAVLEYLGGRILGAFGLNGEQRPLMAFLIGTVLLTLLYMVPVIGLLTFCIFSWWGLGAGVTAIWIALRANRTSPSPAPGPSYPAAAPLTSAQAFTSPSAATSTPTSSSADSPSRISMASSTPALTPPTALAFPRAGFWERMGAGFLDMVLVTLTSAVLGPLAFIVVIAYFSGLWAWKGTTVGGIVLNLQVVRVDGRPLNFLTGFVRCLAAMFSAAVLFLGFFWIGWDRDKQGWHDKIAGTVVVRVPRAASLVCI
jgi:uncharacterized RDD family membrane protein YckC